MAVTLEADGTGAIYPVLYSRGRGEIRERAMLDPIRCCATTADARRDDRGIVARRVPERPDGLGTMRPRRVAFRPGAPVGPRRPRSVSSRFGKANRSFVRPSSGREKNDDPGRRRRPDRG